MDARRTRSGNRHDAIKMFLCAIMIASLFFSSAAFADTLIVIEKETTSDTLLAGDPIIYRILYRVASLTEPAYNMKITDVLPPQVSGAAADVQLYGTTHTASAVYNASTRTATFTFISPLAAGSSGVLRVQTKYLPGSTPDGTTSENVATVTADNAPTVTTPPVPVTAISTFEMTAVKDITSGGNLDNQTTYRLRLRNPDLIGGLNFTNVVITDQLPAGAVYVASSNSGVYNPATHTVTWPPIATVSAGSSTDALTRTVTVVFPDSVFDVGNTILNSFTAIGVPLGQSQPDTLSALHSHTITANNAAMTIDKTVSATSQEVGKSITYYFTVNNSGNVPLDSLWISDVIPAQDSVTAILVREVNAANPGRVFYQTNTNATWTEVSGGPFSSMTTIPVSSLGLVPGTSITALRWTWPGAPFPFSGWSSPNRPGFTAVIL
ncbi:hypothetical protein GX408_04535, partial [bacterium]|nr:hypothetical protein [bacterium]